MSPMAPAFRFGGLTASYGERPVLDGLEGEIPSGALTTLIGPNGSGKSTLLRVLAGLQPYRGTLTLDRREARSLSRREFGRRVGVVPQQFRTAYPFTVWEVIGMGRLPHRGMFSRGTAEDEERIVAAAERMDVAHLLLRRATELSGGEAQRVSLASVLAQDPPNLLLDEPTSALDPNQAARVFSVLRELAREGKAVVVAVHDLNTALPFSDAFMALKDGRLMARGPAGALDGTVLQALYGAPFLPCRSERGDVLWRALAG